MGPVSNFVIVVIPFSEGRYHHSHSHWINKTGNGLVLTHLGLNPFLLHAYIKDPGEPGEGDCEKFWSGSFAQEEVAPACGADQLTSIT